MTDQFKVISFDMGGTTAKAGIIEDGEPRIVPRFQAGEWLMTTPSLDLVEIGAGGGSIAWIDKSGLVKVGPQSAGADPGPACYPDGGTLPTVTDADVTLGWLNPDFFVGGKFHLNAAAAAKAISSHIAEPLKLELIEAANGIIKIVSSDMVEALRLVTVSRGEDPREYVLVAFGGAGPVHAALLAAGVQDSPSFRAGLAGRPLGDGVARLRLEARLHADPFRRAGSGRRSTRSQQAL